MHENDGTLGSVRIVSIIGSQVVDHLEYNQNNSRLTIRFAKSNAIWQYDNVPLDLFGELVGAESIGSAFNSSIRNQFQSSKLYSVSEAV